MAHCHGWRRGATLVEILVVVGTLAIILGLLLPAVQSVRRTALRAATANQLRQISVGIHNSAAVSGGVLPAADGRGSPNWPISVFYFLRPYIDGDGSLVDGGNTLYVPAYRGTADPSYGAYPGRQGNASFAVNPLVFTARSTLERVADGPSHTIALCERYARCGERVDVTWGLSSSKCYAAPTNDPKYQIPCIGYDHHRATFADRDYDDVLPVRGRAGLTDGSVAGKTFQVAPRPEQCDPSVPQSSFPNGLIVAMGDGSVRTIGKSVAPAVFWSAVTPAGGEVVTNDW